MHVGEMGLLEFLDVGDASFSIPLFQRPYTWGEWQCTVLWQDVMKAAQLGSPHFFGVIFYRMDEDGISLIDGQQRTVTSLLLLSVLAEHLREAAGSKAEIAAAAARISAASVQGVRSRMSEEDRKVPNRAFFEERMRDERFDAEAFWEGLQRFQIVAASLDAADNEQAIFESFNGKGVPLVAADMVRNYLLLAESPEEQARLYQVYWEPIQGLFGDDPGSLRLNNALRAWTVIRCKAPKAQSDALCFDDFKQFVQNEYDGTKEDLMDEMLSFCKVWAENYRYHAVKSFRSTDWAKVGRKTLVSGRPVKHASKESRAFYAKHYGVDSKEAR